MTSVTIPNSVYSLGNSAFSGCSALTDLTIGNSVPSVSSTVFEGCPAIKTLTVNDGAETLAFQSGNSWLANVTKLYMGRNIVNSDNSNINFKALENLAVGNEVAEINASMFANCSSLKEVVLGNKIKSIGDNAFSDCSLTEVVIPPSVENIGASAFAGNSDLATIIMGHQVKSIGDKAFDGCPAETIHITAPNPPTAYNTTFSNYTGKLWVPNEEIVENYYDAYSCWDKFDIYPMVEPTNIVIEGNSTLDADPGDVIQLSATIHPENVTLPHIFWRSTNPTIATVDNNGLVTVHSTDSGITTLAAGDDTADGGCQIIAESLYHNAPIAKVSINAQPAGIEDVIADRQQQEQIDYTLPYDVYNFSGMMIGHSLDNLQTGLYIVRQGHRATKIRK